MRILQVHNRYRQSGGEDTVVSVESRLLEEAGHDVETYVEANPDGRVQSVSNLVVSAWNPAAGRRVSAIAGAFRPDVVHVHNTWYILTPAILRRLHGAGYPIVVTLHNYRLACLNAQFYREGAPCEDCVGRVPWRGVVRACYRDSRLQSAAVASTIAVHRMAGTWARMVDVLVVLSQFAADQLVEAGVPRSRIRVKDNTVDDPGARRQPPSEAGFLLYAGRLSEEKGILDLLDVWAKARPRGMDLVIAGAGPLKEVVESRLPPGATLVGHVDRPTLQQLLWTSRGLVFPSRWYEGQPMILLEAMASGTPIVFPDLGPLPEVVGSAGRSFVAGDRGSLADALAIEPEEANRLGLEARSMFERRFSPSVGLRGLEEVYETAVGRRVAGG